MKYILAAFLACGLILSNAARADDEKKPGAAAEAKPGADETRSGKLQDKPANAAEGVVAVLHSKKTDDLTLSASGDIATKLGDLLKKGASVKVTGAITKGVMKVSNVVETESKKGDKGDKGDDAKAKKKAEKKAAKKDKKDDADNKANNN